ncbi:PD-(D/E)XK nuclease family protein [Actinospongicola halichondriae]|uniref:PD-(D/E)XK nuclease family protein n=1 Tax=Actinospongicola halichondriae TaxID=3236844 RepID=UPI003D549958
MPVETTWSPLGAPAFDVLARLVASAKDDDPLRPVSVVTPSPAAAVGLRRELARRAGGVAVVAFQSLDALAEQIAAPDLGAEVVVGVDREVVLAAIRAELSRSPGRFEGIAHHRSTWETLARTVGEVSTLPEAERSKVATAGGLGAEVVRLHDAIASSVGIGGRVEVFETALRRVTATPSAVAPLGPVIVYLPARLDAPALSLLRCLGEVGDVRVIAGITGVADVDRASIETVVAVGGTGPADHEVPVPVTATDIVSANDIDDEVRAAVRALLSQVDETTPLHSMALVHPSASPYARSVAETLRSAGIPFSGPSTETLGHTAPGRVVLGVLDVAAQRFSRQSIVDLWSSGVVIGEDGTLVRSVALDHRSRRLGILGGRDDWESRVEGRRAWLDEHPVEPVASDPVRTEQRRRGRATELAELQQIDAAVGVVGSLIDAIPPEWTALADWVSEALDALCGPSTRRTEWPAHELDADTAIRTALGRLAALDDVDPSPPLAVVIDTVRSVLEMPAPRRGGTGSGLLVTTLDHPPIVPLRAVAVVGLAEGHLPRPVRDDVLLSDTLRRAIGLPVADDHTLDQRRSLATSLAAADRVRVLTYARCDQRSGRRQVPSRWLVDAIEATSGDRPRTEHLLEGAEVPGVEVIASHAAATSRVAAGALALDESERQIAALAEGDFDAHPAALDPVVASGATLARHRLADAFTRFDGNLEGDGIDVLAEDERHLSPTGIETYATCPRKWFFRNGLGIGEVDRPEEVDRLQPRDKGTLTHRILERFVGDAIEADIVPAPGETWGDDDLRRLATVADEEFCDFERRGLTGHPRWWEFDRQEILQVLVATIHHDDVLRAATQSTPTAVELTFGRDGVEPLRVVLDDGRTVPLAGQADRVDIVPGGVRVYDYKYASATPYNSIKKSLEDGGDPLDGGRRLQLVAYAEAAAAQRGVDEASAWYWFLKPGHTGTHIGYDVTPDHRRLFRQTLGVLVDGVGSGRFPAHSGSDNWFTGTNENCGYCEFNDICPADREEEWERVRADPALADLVRLAEEGSPAFLVTAPSGEVQA